MDSSPPGSSIHGIFQARILEWVAISFSRRSSLPRDWTQVSRIAGRFFTNWATRDENKKTTGGKVIKLKYQSYVLTNRKSEKKKEKKDRNGEQNYQREEKKNTFQSWRMGILWGQSYWVYTLWIKKKKNTHMKAYCEFWNFMGKNILKCSNAAQQAMLKAWVITQVSQ